MSDGSSYVQYVRRRLARLWWRRRSTTAGRRRWCAVSVTGLGSLHSRPVEAGAWWSDRDPGPVSRTRGADGVSGALAQRPIEKIRV